MAAVTLSRQNIIDIVTAGGAVALPQGPIIRTLAQANALVQSDLDAGRYDSPLPTVDVTGSGGMTRPLNGRQFSSLKAGGSTTFIGDGDIAVATGAHTADGPTAALPYSRVRMTSGAVSGNQGAVHGQAMHLWSAKPLLQAIVSTFTSIAVCRIWVGLYVPTWVLLLPNDTPGATSAQPGAGFRYSTVAGDVNWKCVTSDATGDTVVDSGVPVAVSTLYKLEIYENGAATVFKINGNVVATISTTRPAAASVLRKGAGIQTAEAVAKAMAARVLYVDED